MALRTHALGALALLLGGAANVARRTVPIRRDRRPAARNGTAGAAVSTIRDTSPTRSRHDVAKLALKWAFGYANGSEFGQPTVVDVRLFVTSSSGRVYSLDAKTGCTYWTYDAAAGNRAALIVGELARSRVAPLPRRLKRTLAHLDVIKAPSAAFFGDDTGTVYALDAQKGTLLWKTQVETHPLARIMSAPTLSTTAVRDRIRPTLRPPTRPMAAVLSRQRGGARHCRRQDGGRATPCSKSRFRPATLSAFRNSRRARQSPVADRDIARSALRRHWRPATGIEQSLTDAARLRTDGSCAGSNNRAARMRNVRQRHLSPDTAELATGAQVLLAGQKSGMVYGLDPDHGGDTLWQTKVADSGGVAWGSAADYRSMYVATSGLLAPSPIASGSLTAVDLKTGSVRWHTPSPQPTCSWVDHSCAHGQAQAVTVMPGSAFSGSLTAICAPTDHQRQDIVGLRHSQGLSNQERRQGERRSFGSWWRSSRTASPM